LSRGGIGGLLVCKIVKPTKVFYSRFSDECGVNQLLLSKAKSYVGTADARVLRETYATVSQKLGRFNAPDRFFDQLPETTATFSQTDKTGVSHVPTTGQENKVPTF
jgi:hypothetical protein